MRVLFPAPLAPDHREHLATFYGEGHVIESFQKQPGFFLRLNALVASSFTELAS